MRELLLTPCHVLLPQISPLKLNLVIWAKIRAKPLPPRVMEGEAVRKKGWLLGTVYIGLQT